MKKFKRLLLGSLAAAAVFIGVAIPVSHANMNAPKIIDISQYQGNINWSKTAPNVKYAIIRVQHGVKGYHDYQYDSKHRNNAAQADAYGVPYGEYSLHAFNSKKEAKKAAIAFLRHADKRARFYALDNEWQRGRKHKRQSAYVKVWRKTMRKYTKRPLIYYANEGVARKTNHNGFDGTWIAKYSKNAPSVPAQLWQFGGTYVPGIRGKVDTDVPLNEWEVNYWFSNEQLTKPTKKPKISRHKARRHKRVIRRKAHRVTRRHR